MIESVESMEARGKKPVEPEGGYNYLYERLVNTRVPQRIAIFKIYACLSPPLVDFPEVWSIFCKVSLNNI